MAQPEVCFVTGRARGRLFRHAWLVRNRTCAHLPPLQQVVDVSAARRGGPATPLVRAVCRRRSRGVAPLGRTTRRPRGNRRGATAGAGKSTHGGAAHALV